MEILKHSTMKQGQSFWNSFATRYDQLIQKYAQSTYLAVIELIKLELEEQQIVVEIGTGTGLIALAVADRVKHIHAVDYSPEMILEAQRKQEQTGITNITFREADAYQLPFEKATADRIIAMNILHLLSSPKNVLAECRRILKPGGKLILPTYCHGDNLGSLILSYLSSLSGFKVENRWSVKAFINYLQNNGYKCSPEKVFPGKFPLTYVMVEPIEEER
jgi:ubiquinone/menaquinone biosynthesis C-methylase UbiE